MHQVVSGFLLARHVETEKNERLIHGSSSLGAISDRGREQVHEMASVASGLDWVTRVIPAPTKQAVATARLVSEATGLPLARPLPLQPVKLGMASGKSQDELYSSSAEVAYSMDMFRYRSIPASKLDIPGAESLSDICRRILEWRQLLGLVSLRDSLVIASSSILTMLGNLIWEILPGHDYYNFVAPTGSMRAFKVSDDRIEPVVDLAISSWPTSESLEVSTAWGRIKATKYLPGWEARQAAAVIVPGYFSNTRGGPYGLYTRLAQRLAYEGITSYTFDPLGYGESDPVRRSFESDIVSLRAMVEHANSNHLILIGHSIAGALVSLSEEDLRASSLAITRIVIAPLSGLESILAHVLSADEAAVIRDHRTLIRHGMPVDEYYITSADELWNRGNGTVDLALFGGNDRAAQPSRTVLSDRTSIKIVGDADHNFSHTDSSQGAIAEIVRFVRAVTSSVEIRLGIGGPG